MPLSESEPASEDAAPVVGSGVCSVPGVADLEFFRKAGVAVLGVLPAVVVVAELGVPDCWTAAAAAAAELGVVLISWVEEGPSLRRFGGGFLPPGLDLFEMFFGRFFGGGAASGDVAVCGGGGEDMGAAGSVVVIFGLGRVRVPCSFWACWIAALVASSRSGLMGSSIGGSSEGGSFSEVDFVSFAGTWRGRRC